MNPAAAPAAGPLGAWYADPLDPAGARALLQRSEARARAALVRGGDGITAGLAAMVARFWLDAPIEDEYQRLRRLTAPSPHGRALTELIFGQLLMSRRLNGAMEHLERGFAEARRLFAPADYFLVLSRHTLLRRLPLSDAPSPPEGLEGLLALAGVIEQLEGRSGAGRSFRFDPDDTFG